MNETDKNIAIIIEVDNAIKYLQNGLAEVQRISAANDFYDPLLIYLSGGFERLFKSMLCLNFKEKNNRFPVSNEIWNNRNGHDIKFLKEKVEEICIPIDRPFAKDDFKIITENPTVNEICDILSAYGNRVRYFNLDVILGKEQGFDAKAKWEVIETSVLKEFYGEKKFYEMLEKHKHLDEIYKKSNEFCEQETEYENKELFGVTDGKAVGTYIEHKFKNYLSERFIIDNGNSARGIDLPAPEINTDIKVTSIKQPQSSSPFKDAKQKIYGLGYNLLVFVYEKTDNSQNETAILDFKSCSFISKKRTADYTTTYRLIEMISDRANEEDIIAYLNDKNIPADDITLSQIAKQILEKKPVLGYLTISNALQWRLQYGRVVALSEKVEGITKIIDKVNI